MDLLGSRDFNMDFSSSDLMSGTLKCIFSGFLELMNSFSTSAIQSLKGRLSFISMSLTSAAKYKFISLIISRGLFISPWPDCRTEGSLFA